MKRAIKMSLLGLLAMGLSVSCKPEKEDEPFVPKEPELREDYTETAFGMNLEMVYVKGGEFTMGCTEEQGWNIGGPASMRDSIREKYIRKTKLDSYHIGRYEVTQAQWKAVMGTDPSYFKGDNRPVECVSWNEAQEFCQKLSEQTGRKYVLPTEAMWEYAARGGVHKTKTKFAGSNDIEEVAWYGDNSGEETHQVGKKKANALGIYDMSGNVFEWCSDWYMDRYDKADDYNPQGPASGSYRVIRGGNWEDSVKCRVSSRTCTSPDGHHDSLGFRVAVLP